MKKLAIYIIVLLIFVMFAGCSVLPTSMQPVVVPTTSITNPAAATEATPSPSDDKKVDTDTLVYGCIVPPTGDLCKATELANSTDALIGALIDDASIITLDKNGNYVVNKGVCESFTEVENPDGSKKFAVKLRSGLKYCDGTPVEAKDFLVPLLVYGASYATELGVDRMGAAIMGSDSYFDLSAATFSGVRLVDNMNFEITVKADRLPYFYDLLYANTYPMNVSFWLGQDADVKDDGAGAYLIGLSGVDDIRAKLEAARWQVENRISCGPYTLKSFDSGTYTAVLVKNEYYMGNYEGVKPTIESIVFKCVPADTCVSMLAKGEVDLIDPLPNAQLGAADAYFKEGKIVKHGYPRNGYSKLLFQCDVGPTQYASVRHAVALLLNRDELVNKYCGSDGMVINGPYSAAMWMYQELKDRIYAELNQYKYNADKAMQLLDEDGWVYDETGNGYVSGIRYKIVGESEKNARCITLGDGRILMPLIIDWCSTGNNAVAALIDELLASAPETQLAGMLLVHEELPLDELLKKLYRDEASAPKYCMYSLATDYSAAYDYSYTFTMDPQLRRMGYNLSYANDERLNRLSMEMVNGVSSENKNEFRQKWFEFVKQFNEYLPELPLCSNTFYALSTVHVKEYAPNALFDFPQAVLYAKLDK